MSDPALDRTSGSSDTARSSWQEQLLGQLRRLGPDIGSRVLTSPPSAALVVPAERFHDRAILRRAIRDCGASLSGAMDEVADQPADVRPAASASRFTRHYVSSMTAAAFVGMAQGVGLDLSARRCVKVIQQGIPRQHLVGPKDQPVLTCKERPTMWSVDGPTVATVDELRGYVLRQFYAEHLAPLFAAVSELTGASPRLLWSNAAEWVAQVADRAADHLTPGEASTFIEEADAVLRAETLPGVEGANPLRGLMEWVDVDASDFPRGMQTRRHCCITYLLPARLGRLCENCPFLPVPERVALARETRDGPARGGPAERRSIEIGLRKLRTKARRAAPGS